MDEKERDELLGLVKAKNAKGVIRLTMTVDFLVPGYERQTLDSLAKEWFERFHLGQHHAYRDGCKIGFSEQLVDYETIEE